MRWQAGPLTLELGPTAEITGLWAAGQDRLAPGRGGPLLRLGREGRIWEPLSLVADPGDGAWRLAFDGGTVVALDVRERGTHLAIRIAAITGPEPDLVLLGPLAVTVAETVGETVGVVRDAHVALGICALNPETIGGWPEEMPAEPGEGEVRSPFADCAAWRTPWGSRLQAYARGPGFAPRPGPAAPRSLVGCGVAIFACPAGEALATIGRIEVAEGLPHPTLDGAWAKTAAGATAPYLISEFGEADLPEVLACAQAAGLRYIYHGEPFRTWGHFELRPDHFPDGDAALARVVAAAAREGIGVGVHTLTNFLTTNDGYITPRPNAHLQRSATGHLQEAATADATEITVDALEPYAARGILSTVAVGEELIQYTGTSAGPPATLTGCQRGAFGTTAAAHPAGAEAGKLADHDYRVFFPDITLQDAVADRLATLFATTGLRQISFDGLEGCRETGHGAYAEARFVQYLHDRWQTEVVNDASRLAHYTWHIHTRMNWGEPWGAAMRQGQTAYRFANCRYFDRNLFPSMLGWFLCRLASAEHEATTLDDIEWMLARAAAYDAGFALVAGLAVLRGHGQLAPILAAVRRWEEARTAGAFSLEQRRLLQSGEWHLEADGTAGWRLAPLWISEPQLCSGAERQPGQPGGAEWPVENPFGVQALRFRLRVLGPAEATVSDPALTAGGRRRIYRTTLGAAQYLVDDGVAATVCDANWNVLRQVPVEGEAPVLGSGPQGVSFSCAFGGASATRVEARLMASGPGEPVPAGQRA